MGTQPLSAKRGRSGPNFRPMFIVAKRLDGSRWPWHGGKHQLRRLCVRWGPSPLPKKGAEPPQFSTHVCCGQTSAWIKMPLGTVVALGPGNIVLDVIPALPSPKRVNFSAHVYCGQMARYIKMSLGMEVGHSPGDFVLHGTQPPLQIGAEPPIFGPRLLWPYGCMDQDATWYRGRLRPTRHCVRWGSSLCPPLKGHNPPPIFVQCPL